MQKSFTKNAPQSINIDRLASLSRLSFENEEQRELAAAELKKMADYTYSFIDSVKCEGSSLPFSYCVANADSREDEAISPDPEECKKILALSPSNKDGYITVPKIIKGDEK